MKIIVTGSLGNISRPLTEKLVQKGHVVVVVSSRAARQKDIESLGAMAAIGSLQDTGFLEATFKDADVVYTMVPPANYFDHSLDLISYYRRLANSYLQAIRQSGVKRVINLSSIGAHLEKGNGILEGTYQVEQLLNRLPPEVAITHIRPTEFYYNLLPHAHSAKNNGYIAMNIGKDVVNAWVSPRDIAGVIAEEISLAVPGRKVRYVASEEITYKELIGILGKAVGDEELQWQELTDEQMTQGLVGVGMNPQIAMKMAEMYAAIHSGLLYEDYDRNRPAVMGSVKMADFAKDFAHAYSQL
ncbi:NAD-dependent epimerase/dehydratase family protein [Flavobacterium alkalisoli]|uniref:NAD-dependent epimerase/dehydratase family protein n=1 Tax=Flavobacterium alkalisoli TaxID=2602769 RepID=A0A5B9FVM7_9FLAO|nr:NAD(P)H-binding protein [Flavobacterium alkalisoli]QEE51014.1 NAD-dependent epimerase/dehydratase family protein [Flavobacterium alkalisoli]